MTSRVERLMDVRSAHGTFVVGNGRSSLRGGKNSIVRGSRSLRVYHRRQVEGCGGTTTNNAMRSAIYLALRLHKGISA